MGCINYQKWVAYYCYTHITVNCFGFLKVMNLICHRWSIMIHLCNRLFFGSSERYRRLWPRAKLSKKTGCVWGKMWLGFRELSTQSRCFFPDWLSIRYRIHPDAFDGNWMEIGSDPTGWAETSPGWNLRWPVECPGRSTGKQWVMP